MTSEPKIEALLRWRLGRAEELRWIFCAIGTAIFILMTGCREISTTHS